jgi:hypothetical protein
MIVTTVTHPSENFMSKVQGESWASHHFNTPVQYHQIIIIIKIVSHYQR